MADEKTTNEVLLEVQNLIDEIREDQDEMRKCRQTLINHENSINPHGLTNPNSKIYENIKKIVERVLEDMATEGKIILVKDAE